MRRVLNLFLDTTNDSTALKSISLQINLLYMQYIYYAEDEEAVRKGRKITDGYWQWKLRTKKVG